MQDLQKQVAALTAGLQKVAAQLHSGNGARRIATGVSEEIERIPESPKVGLVLASG